MKMRKFSIYKINLKMSSANWRSFCLGFDTLTLSIPDVTFSCGVIISCSKFDLYSKADALPDPEALKPHYQSLIEKYLPGELQW